MVEVNGVYKYGTYENKCLKSLHVMSNVKVFATQTNMTHYIDPHGTHMDQKE